MWLCSSLLEKEHSKMTIESASIQLSDDTELSWHPCVKGKGLVSIFILKSKKDDSDTTTATLRTLGDLKKFVHNYPSNLERGDIKSPHPGLSFYKSCMEYFIEHAENIALGKSSLTDFRDFRTLVKTYNAVAVENILSPDPETPRMKSNTSISIGSYINIGMGQNTLVA